MPTATERAPAPVGPVVPTWITRVAGTAEVSPRIRQVTVSGGLEGFVPGAPDQFVHVLAPPPGRSTLPIDRTFSWEAHRAMAEEDRPVGAYYTIRRWDPVRSSIDLWVVQHGHDGDGERWARTAAAGDPVALWGPREAYAPPAGCGSRLLLGDETALPAIAAILESLDGADRATVVIVVQKASHAIPLHSPATVDLRWVVRTGEPDPLLATVRRLDRAIDASTYVWGGGESREITTVRRHVRDVLGHPPEMVSLTGYWRGEEGVTR